METITNRAKKAKFYVIMADETSAHQNEFLSLSLRFVDESFTIHEMFIGYRKIQTMTGVGVKESIIKFCNEISLPTQDVIGSYFSLFSIQI